ncbi:MAG: mechanosensitive ion channel domain-containing protein [Planctomycetota bacterium]
MKLPLTFFVNLMALIAVCAGSPAISHAQDEGKSKAPEDPIATTTSDPSISLEELGFLIKPMTAEETKGEVDGWLELVREKAGEVAEEQAAVRRMTEQQETSREASPEAPADEAQTTKAKEETLEEVNTLRQAELDLLDRLDVVLDSLESKGGDVESIRKYAEVQRGVQVDTSDWQAIWIAAKGWFLSDDGGKVWVWRLLAFALILFTTRIIAGIVSSIVKRILDRTSHLSQLAESLVRKSVRNVIYAIGFLVALASLGIDIGPLLAAVGATGFIIGFALQGTLSNFASGLMILLNRPFDVGDVVTAGGVTGTVSEMNLVSTTFSTFDNQKIIVPNNEIWDNVITNVTARDTRRVDLQFGVGYDDDLSRVEAILNDAVKDHPLVLDDPEPVIKLNELADSSVNFICRPWAKTTDYWAVYWDLTKTIKQRFDESGISIPYPQQDIHVRADLVQS